jgi:hypothetical protein
MGRSDRAVCWSWFSLHVERSDTSIVAARHSGSAGPVVTHEGAEGPLSSGPMPVASAGGGHEGGQGKLLFDNVEIQEAARALVSESFAGPPIWWSSAHAVEAVHRPAPRLGQPETSCTTTPVYSAAV